VSFFLNVGNDAGLNSTEHPILAFTRGLWYQVACSFVPSLDLIADCSFLRSVRYH